MATGLEPTTEVEFQEVNPKNKERPVMEHGRTLWVSNLAPGLGFGPRLLGPPALK